MFSSPFCRMVLNTVDSDYSSWADEPDIDFESRHPQESHTGLQLMLQVLRAPECSAFHIKM